MITGMLHAAAVLGVTGILIGIILGIAGEKFKLETDKNEGMVRDALPGINCGRCGYAGCDALAKAISDGTAPVTACPVGGKKSAEKIREIMKHR
jgi:RnfABCDGE-type electron transport complex B subunit